MRRLRPLLALVVAITLMPVGATPAPAARAAQATPPSLTQAPLPGLVEAEPPGGASNNTVAGAEPIGARAAAGWTQVITGTIGSSADLDFYSFSLAAPASQISIRLSGPPADYDLVLGGGQDTSQTTIPGEAFQEGLEEITQVGGSIKSIGGSIKSIGGSIKSIGGSIKSIGGSIKSIGGSIKSISAQAGTASETIDTRLWLPGEYVIAVTTSNGEFSATAPYRLEVTLLGSGLAEPLASPEVSVELARPFFAAPEEITTLYIHYPARLAELYPAASDEIGTIDSALSSLTAFPPAINGAPPEYGLVLDLGELLGSTETITDVYDAWEANQANPFYANYVAGLIDNMIESAIAGQPSGPAPAFTLGSAGSAGVAFPNVRNVVFVGGDEISPFYRLPDLTAIANEAEYAAYLRTIDPSGIIAPGNPLGAALRYGMLLSDAPYGSGRPYNFYGFPFFVPNLAVGRLVETPGEIAAFLSHYNSGDGSRFVIDLAESQRQPGLRRAFVSGYDFLKDEAVAVGATLLATGLAPSQLNLLNTDAWRRPELEAGWFDGALASEFPEPSNPPGAFVNGVANLELSSLNAHFDHWQLLPAIHDANQAGNFPARRVLAPQYQFPGELPSYFGGTLGYSVGCHSGYNVPAAALAPLGSANAELYGADFAQALNAHGGNWVGNTGYGYGTADGIDYSERLALLYTQELVRETFDTTGTLEIGASIGAALVQARQRYVRNAASLSEYDYKVLSVMTLYGLPFARVNVENALEPPAEEPAPGRTTPLETPAPVPPDLTTGRLTRTITFTIDLGPDDFVAVPRTGSTLLELDPADFSVVDEFVQRGVFPAQGVRVFDNSQVGAPTLPGFAYDLGARNSVDGARLEVVDVVFIRGSYGARPGFDPQITQVATETLDATPIVSRTDEPGFEAGAGIWYPDKFFGYSSVGEGDQQRDQLTSFAAQFRADANGVTGLLRPYEQMVFQVFYDDPRVTGGRAELLDADTEPPLIATVRVQGPGGGLGPAQARQAIIAVEASDRGPILGGPASNQGLAEVSAIYVRGGVAWERVVLSETAPGSGLFTATVPVKPADLRFIVRATDVAGNSSYYTGKGRFTPLRVVALPFVSR